MQLQEEISRLTRQHFDRAPDQCDDHQLYQALLILARQRAQAVLYQRRIPYWQAAVQQPHQSGAVR